MMNAMFEEKFIKLVEENGGFEFYQAYRNDMDHILGAVANRVHTISGKSLFAYQNENT